MPRQRFLDAILRLARRPRVRVRVWRSAALALLALLATAPGGAQEAAEHEVKAAMVLSIARFTQWPATALGATEAPFLICTAGEGDSVQAVGLLEGKTLHGRVIRVAPLDRQAALADCRLLFVARSETYRLNQLSALMTASLKPVLTIGDIRGFATRGGMVALTRLDERIRFEINPREVDARGLAMSSRLLSLAIIVKKGEGQ